MKKNHIPKKESTKLLVASSQKRNEKLLSASNKKNLHTTSEFTTNELEECYITSDIQRNVISELQERVVKAERPPDNVITPASHISVQVFYAQESYDFKETHSLTKIVTLAPIPTPISFDISPTTEVPCFRFFRFDLGSAPGLINIHSIEIKNTHKEVLWAWDKTSLDFKRNIILFQNNKLWPGKVVQLSTWIDPLFYISTDNSVLEASHNGLKICVTLSAIDDVQLQSINDLTLPFSCVSENKYEELEQKTGSLSREIELARYSVENLTDQNSLINRTLKTNEQLIEQVVDEKKILLTEIAEKNNIINNLFSNKEKIEKNALSNVTLIENLKNELLSKDKLIAENTGIKKMLESNIDASAKTLIELREELIHKNNIIAILKAEKEALEKSIKEISFESNSLKNSLMDNEGILSKLSLAKNALELDYEAAKKTIIDAEKKIATLTLQYNKTETTLKSEREITVHLKEETMKLSTLINEKLNTIHDLTEKLNEQADDIAILKKDNTSLFNKNKHILNEIQVHKKQTSH